MPSAVFAVAETATSTGLSIDTVKANVVVPLSVSVTDGLLIETVAVSLSVIVMTLLVVVPSVRPDERLAMESVAVSVTASTSESSVTVNVTLPLVCPFGIVIVVPDSE